MQKVFRLLIGQKGVTLVETLFVLVVAATFITIGFRIYDQFQTDKDITRVKANVDALFQSMRGYYISHCATNRDYTTGDPISSVAALDPLSGALSTGTTSPSSIPINISTQLVNTGYLSGYPFPFSPIASNYLVQFNLYQGGSRQVQFCYSGNCASLATQAQHNIYLLTIQIAVQVDSTEADFYQKVLGGNCLSSLAGLTVTPCRLNTANTGNYVVFERVPSYASTKANSPLWMSMPVLKQFKRQYTNDEYYSVIVSDPNYVPNYENYLCGG